MALVLFIPVLLVSTATPALASPMRGDCQEPIPVGSYDDAHMSYGLSVDYSTCSWWDGLPEGGHQR